MVTTGSSKLNTIYRTATNKDPVRMLQQQHDRITTILAKAAKVQPSGKPKFEMGVKLWKRSLQVSVLGRQQINEHQIINLHMK